MTPRPPLTAEKIVAYLRQQSPYTRYATDNAGTCVGVFSQALGRFQLIGSKTLDGTWYALPQEILINGLPPDINWLE